MSRRPEDDVVETPEGDQDKFLSMSDEEMLAAAPPSVTQELPTPETTDEATKVEDESAKADAEGGDAEDAGTAAEKSTTDAEDEGDEKVKDPKDPAKTTKVEEVTEESKEKAPTETKEAPAIDYKAEYERLMAPFKANGREIKVDSVDDAVALMQMGANYNKKMAALKPNLKLMKMLENNGLLSEEKISFLIDLGQKNPGAINKLVKDSGLDPMDLDAEKASAYKQTAYAVDDREIELDTVLDELQDSPVYTQLLDVVSNKWDVASKQIVAQSPQLLKVLNDHMASGIYKQISTEIERERLFGRLNGLSDIEAYRRVGDAIHARGGFNRVVPDQTKTAPASGEVVQPRSKPAEDDKLKDKRRAASSTKTAAPSSPASDFNPLALPDAEFLKQATPKYQ